MPVDLNFYMASSTDGFSPAQDTPTVLLWWPLGGSWVAPTDGPVSLGAGWWRVPSDGYPATADSPLLLYATAADAYPGWFPYFPDGAVWTQGQTSPPFPFWMGTHASNGELPAAGLAITLQVCPPGSSAFSTAAGLIAEPGGAGNGNGWYVYYPSPAEIAGDGDMLFFGAAAGAVDYAALYQVEPIPTPAPAPVPPAPVPAGPPYSSPFPQSSPSAVWDILVGALRSDPILNRAVDTWQVMRGSEEDLLEPTDEDLPLLRLEPVLGSGRWLDENATEYTIPIRVTLGVAGTDVRVLWDFWDAVRNALFNGNTVLDSMYTQGVIQKTLSAPATEGRLFGEASGYAGIGMLNIKMRVNT